MKTDSASPKQRIRAEKTTWNRKRGKICSLKTDRKGVPLPLLLSRQSPEGKRDVGRKTRVYVCVCVCACVRARPRLTNAL